MPGANVSLKGMSIGTITDENGDFLLETNKNFFEAIIVFAFVGFETKEVKISTIDKNALVRANAVVLDIDLAFGYKSFRRDYNSGCSGLLQRCTFVQKIYYKLRNWFNF
ncbi:MAG: hypothetical protein OHK0057_09320 [Thermoflexibacter sp.]